jgi:hypothetical protein
MSHNSLLTPSAPIAEARRPGRPSTLPNRDPRPFIAALRSGESLKDSADYGGIPRATVYRWLRRGRVKGLGRWTAPEYVDFARRVAEARAEGLTFRMPPEETLRQASASPRAARRWLASRRGQGAARGWAADGPREAATDERDIPLPEAWAKALRNPWPTPGRSVLYPLPDDPFKALKRLLLELRLDALRFSPRVWR